MNDIFNMDSWECRIALARMGIHTDTRLNLRGIPNNSGFERSFGVWGKTWYWQGQISEVSLHAHVRIDLREEENAVEQMVHAHQLVLEAFTRAQKEFPDSVPCMRPRLEDGRLGLSTDSWEMEHAKKSDRQIFPTENLPEGCEASSGGNDLLKAQLRLSSKKMHVEDNLNTYTTPGRMLHDCKDRVWQFRTRCAVREYEGTKIAFKPAEFSTRAISEQAASRFTTTFGALLIREFQDFAPGGKKFGKTPNGLPPGIQTLDDYMAEMNAKLQPESEKDQGGIEP